MVCLISAATVKSLRAVRVNDAVIDHRGFVDDRRYMVVTPAPLPAYGEFLPSDATHRFLTQRQCPTLATVVATLTDQTLTCTSHAVPGKRDVCSTTPRADAPVYRATIWKDIVMVQDMGDEVAAFLQKVVDRDDAMPDEMKPNVRLVKQVRYDRRRTCPDFVPAAELSLLGGQTHSVALSDGYPLLVACEASLEELNRRIKKQRRQELPMSRFRPNIVISGTKPFEEDRWKVIRIGDTVLQLTDSCPRCKESCTDQTTGHVTKDPVDTLSTFRALNPKVKENVYFARNAVPSVGSVGRAITVGSRIEVLQWGEPVYKDGS